ncbi:hypothetical protein WR25_18469 [Diploscapter pachys]|uniref:Uncharacterized protein n=1 Tax=Diploscapter pachys TaxID=2018661 RepID=A0A2A2K056_9BILA|nr:hypothetical protein WR25_18469 [Diploscapter pachys]
MRAMAASVDIIMVGLPWSGPTGTKNPAGRAGWVVSGRIGWSAAPTSRHAREHRRHEAVMLDGGDRADHVDGIMDMGIALKAAPAYRRRRSASA